MSPSTVTFHVGDVRDRIADIPDHSVDLIVTSPPFLALRSYLPPDHPDKHREIGAEPTPAAFLDTLLELTAEWRRLLTPTGSLCVELGDTYSGSGGAGGDYREGGMHEGQLKFRQRTDGGQYANHQGADTKYNEAVDRPVKPSRGWPLAKSLCGIPALYQIALAYGHNPLTGAPSPAGQWRVRNLLVWTRPNPPVGALGDKFRPATSYVTVACTSDKLWFDLDAVRGEPARTGYTTRDPRYRTTLNGDEPLRPERVEIPASAPPLDWHHDDTADWQPLHRLPTAPYPGAHYATYPLALPRKLIEAMCPRQVCTVCGEPRRRLTNVDYVGHNGQPIPEDDEWRSGRGGNVLGLSGGKTPANVRTETLGWSDCNCEPVNFGPNFPNVQGEYSFPKFRPGHVLDPFAGSGTTLLAAALTGRDATGIDIDQRNRDLTLERLRDACHVTLDGGGPMSSYTWTVHPDLPGLKHEHPDQQSLFA